VTLANVNLGKELGVYATGRRVVMIGDRGSIHICPSRDVASASGLVQLNASRQDMQALMRSRETGFFNIPPARERPVRKTKVVFSVVGMVILSLWAITGKAAQNDFSGTWVLDKEKTHGLASELKSYTMVVAQTEQELSVETKVEGDLQPEREPGESFPGGGPPPGGPVDGGPPGGPEGGGPPGGGPPSGTVALRMVIPKATYPLSGEVTTADSERPGRGAAKLRAKWSKDGKTLELSSARNMNFGGNTETFTTKERWTLSEGGETLKLQRSVETPMGIDTVKLTFRKGKAEPQTPQQ